MRDSRRRMLVLVSVVAAAAVPATAQTSSSPPSRPPVDGAPESSANVGLSVGPLAIGKWMLTAQGEPSDWLGEIHEGKNLREPVNVIIQDDGADSADDAKARLLMAASLAGYPVRFGHSTGYHGYIGGQLYGQLPQGRDDALSNDVFEVSNNHGRIFGPHRIGRTYVFTAAFSREAVNPFRPPRHLYASFNRARDDFTQGLDRSTDYKITAYVNLENAIVGDLTLTTGDHDGIAVLVYRGN